MARVQYISQGEIAIGRDAGDVISTILGSCVSVCLWDPGAGFGGMNHMLLPSAGTGIADQSRGAVEIERLINTLIRGGAERGRMRAKVFGGASMLGGRTEIGARNSEFVMSYLDRERIPVEGHSLGGESARQVKFWPAIGEARQRFVRGQPLSRAARTPELGGDLELF